MRRFAYLVPMLAATMLVAIAGAGCTAKMKASHHLKRAEQYFNSGQYDQAAIEYKNVLRNAPQNAEAWSRLGVIYFDEGRLAEARQILGKAEQLAPNDLDVRLKLGAIYLAAGKLKEARDEANFVLDRAPGNDQAPILLAEASATPGEITDTRQRLKKMSQTGETAPLDTALGTLWFRQGNLQNAETYFRGAVTRDPKFADAYSALGNLYIAQKELDQADHAFKTAADLAPPRSGKDLQYAQFKIVTGDADTGQRLLQEIVKKTPDYLPGWIALTQLDGAEKKYADGITLLGNVLGRDPQNLEGLLLKVRLEMQEGKTAQAIDDSEVMVKIFSQVPLIYYQLAQARLANNETDKAIANLNQAINLNPRYADAILALAEIQIRNGNVAPAIVSLQQLIQQQPQMVPARLLLAEAYRAQGNPDGAVQIYKQLINAYPKNAQFPFLLGTTFLQQKKNADAHVEFEEALRLAPDYVPALEQMVNVDLAEGQPAAALQRVQQKIKQNPKEPALQLLLANVLLARGDTNGAQNTLLKVIEMQPDSEPAYLMLAHVYSSSKQYGKALAELQAVLAKKPQDPSALMLMGLIYSAEKDYKNAADAYERLLAVAPDNGTALNNLAYIYAENLGQLDKGYELARRARDLAPADPSVADTLGWILYQKTQYFSALSLLRESATKLYAVPEVQFHLGMAYYMMGDEANARTTFQQALQQNKDFPEKDECNQRLAVLAIDPNTAGANTRAWLEKDVASQPNDSIALLRLAAIYQREGTPDKAAATFEAALQANPQNVTAMVNLARLYEPRDPQTAFNMAKAAYNLTPNDPQVAYTLGHLAFLTGDYQWALSLLQLTAQMQPQNPEVLFDLAEAFYSVGRVPEARTAMQSALQTGAAFSRTEEAKHFLAMTGLADNPAAALAAQSQVDAILKSSPGDVPALMVKAVIAEQKSGPAAEQAYEDALKRYPDFTPAEKQLAMIYAKDPNNDARAYTLAVKARTALPDDAEVAKTLGILVFRQGDYSRAANLFQESALKRSGDAELMYYLGMAQYHLKNRPESKISLERALALDLSGTEAVETKQILAELK